MISLQWDCPVSPVTIALIIGLLMCWSVTETNGSGLTCEVLVRPLQLVFIFCHLKFTFRCRAGGIQQQSNHEVTAQLDHFNELLTVLLEYIDLYYALFSFLGSFYY